MAINKITGFTLVEILIGITILLFLIAAGYFALRGQIGKGNDAKRKDDLARIKVAFEDYYNDNGCYPEEDVLDNCGGEELQPYLNKIPCDPVDNDKPYILTVGTRGQCVYWYKVYTLLENEADPIIETLGLSGEHSVEGEPVNYGVCSSNVAVGDVTATEYICPSTGEPAPREAGCSNPYDYLGVCGSCGCFTGELISQGPMGYYCCPDVSCE